MKTLLTLIAALVLGCGDSLESENKRLEAELNEKREKLAAEEKNKKLKEELRRYELAGNYELRTQDKVGILALLENGEFQVLENGKLDEEGTWENVDEEIHLTYVDKKENSILKIKPNGDLTFIGWFSSDANRVEVSKDRQETLKKSSNPK